MWSQFSPPGCRSRWLATGLAFSWDKSLAHGGLSRWLPITVSGDDVATPKPHPACYLAACAALGIEPGSALAVEDSPVGARAAHAAGMTVLGVGTLALGRTCTLTYPPSTMRRCAAGSLVGERQRPDVPGRRKRTRREPTGVAGTAR
ncbi:HAD family hydrolase [Streptomyces canus]|uniref:HAD family hydrolase n=1 Tax=Streptomyces canus TaxID=58343 RepID=UPI0027D8FE88|nr:HAD family hydrolase [Streptomyces canus]